MVVLRGIGKGERKRAAGLLLSALVMLLGASPAARELSELPREMILTRGRGARMLFSMPLKAEIAGGAAVSLSLDEPLTGGTALSIDAREPGSALLLLKLLGVPVRTVNLTVSEPKYLVPGGESIGVAIKTEGVLLVGASDLGAAESPARAAGLRAGDRILSADGQPISGAQALSDKIRGGEKLRLGIERAGEEMEVEVAPVRDGTDGAYRLGAWVRDSTAGVGTLSYWDPEDLSYGALGHAISDIDTGSVMTVSAGSIYKSRVLDVLPGKSGEPGEVLGDFLGETKELGDVRLNGEYGIYGRLAEPIAGGAYPAGVPALSRSEVRPGPARILTTLRDGRVKAYDCVIERAFRQDEPSQRGMVLRVTDAELIAETGGIVQGMSGSPILQDGYLAGAVTHVFLGDPTRGYGMYIDWMLVKDAEIA